VAGVASRAGDPGADNTGTQFRRELRAPVSFQEHPPAIVARTPLGAGGQLDIESPA
jgi:hypothetical protein